MGYEPGLAPAFGALGRDRMWNLLGAIAVTGLADIPALLGVLAEGVPRQLQHLQHVPLGHGLLNSTCEHGRRPLACASAARAVELRQGLVGREQHHPGLLQLVLDLRAEVRTPGDPLNGLADDGGEAAIRPLRLSQQILNPAVARDRNIEGLVRSPTTPGGKIHPPGLDVIEVSDDKAPVR
ncbi:hypothetical protein [Microbispora sp. H10830]|uniref:hypothetical protein n=1 Tax=Microbispora sp. H10830 TaxID=2729109 RepID=UPI0021758489|nr:hypothetical protein [Microbispora sp. H10830]